jgi:hypothetical protein
LKNQVLLSVLLLLFCKAYPQQGYWQQQLHYTIDVELNDKTHSLDGFLKLRYHNQSPDTLHFIWFHLWPNAYKNDRTAFSEQMLENGRTDFYFSDKEQRGYINRLDFRINNSTLKTEDHPLYIDIIKVHLPQPLAPGAATEITTPFHVKLPYSFSRGGHSDQSYMITQWYPKPAVYDKNGWHPMPYLDQGEFYGEFGNYDVRITIPDNYVVAAGGELQNAEEKEWLLKRSDPPAKPKPVKKIPGAPAKKPAPVAIPEIKSSAKTKTLRYLLNNTHDFAWFADKYYGVLYDTLQLPSGKIIGAFSFYTKETAATWKNSIKMMKDAILFRSQLLGDYPYNVVSIAESKMGFETGMEYPGIASLWPVSDEKELDLLINHELGHNWFYAALASNERQYPWMDEGLNTYFDQRYEEWKYGTKKPGENAPGIFRNKIPDHAELAIFNTLAAERKDQPIQTNSEDFTAINYGVIAYYKTAFLLTQLEHQIGRGRLDSCLRLYYQQWKFKHPQPEDLIQVLRENAGQDISSFVTALNEKGKTLPATQGKKKIKPSFLFNLQETHKYSYINFFPAIGFNKYDGLMLGALVHNYNAPPDPFRFIAAPLFATGSKKLNGIGNLSYAWFPQNHFQKIEARLGFSAFSFLEGVDSNGSKIFGGFNKIAPAVRLTFKNKSARSTKEQWIEWKTFLIGERGFDYVQSSFDSLFYPKKGSEQRRYLNQLSYALIDYRALYPYDINFQLQQGKNFYRASINANYFLNYAKAGGASVRFFAAKFGYLGGKTTQKEFDTYVYQPKLTAVRGNEDYTYSNYFFGRNENEGFASQQMMMRDGGLKLRTDLFQGLQGRSDDWIAAININTTIPSNILPKIIPLRLFLDVGTYADAWDKGSNRSRFLYVGGLQLSLLKGFVNVYAPLVYSSEFRDNLKTVPEENKFFRKISFSIDVHRFSLRRALQQFQY